MNYDIDGTGLTMYIVVVAKGYSDHILNTFTFFFYLTTKIQSDKNYSYKDGSIINLKKKKNKLGQ